ncbi:MAG: hypothetical protein DWQ05_11525 [Calditrichaeota bacterium]|nr:MAG: hypothetical protein DWQ05_11525 [Calditrichota bacterium]
MGKMIGNQIKNTIWLVLFFLISAQQVYSQNSVLTKGVLSKNKIPKTNQRISESPKSQNYHNTKESDPILVKEMRRFVKNNRIRVNFEVTNNSIRSYQKLYFVLRISDDQIINSEDKIASIIPIHSLRIGLKKKIQASFTFPEGESLSAFVGYTLSEDRPEFSLAKSENKNTSGVKIRLKPANLIINQQN